MEYSLDAHDRKILYELELNARQNYSQIAKKLHISKEVARYRIKKLEQERIINQYVTILNNSKFGYESFKLYIQFENVNNHKLDEIICYLKNHPNCGWIQVCSGKWDMIVVFFVESSLQFSEIKDALNHKFYDNIRETNFTIERDVYHFKKKYLGEEKLTLHETPYFGGKLETISLDEQEIKILDRLCKNPRESIVDIAAKTNLTIEIVRYRTEKLERIGIIQGARIEINYQKLGFSSFKLLLNIKAPNKEKENELISYLKAKRNVADVIHCLGNWNIEINVDVRESKEFYDFIMDLKDKFSGIVKGYDSIQMFMNHKYNFFPMGESWIKKKNGGAKKS